MLELSPSLLSADFTDLKSEIEVLDKNGVKYLHLDVMDGMFVPNISFGPMIIKQLRPLTNMVFDVHLMIEDPDRYVQNFKDAGADILTVHYEACKHLHRTVSYIKSLGMKAGVSLNPATNIDVLDYVLEDLDLVLIMSVNPGFGGQSFIPSAIDKIKNLKAKIRERNLNVIVEVDGGVKTTNVKDVIEAGADLIVSGSDVFADKENRIRAYKEIFKNYEK
ncbi:ribulose-phosphate 3-epimerase [Parvimonas micra]|uniref:ribulose-phosphate 3-epimerase n=1 Tax=Parvimonas micra TaxID=33033 RepID=UPI002003F8BD|nr:ribulose-phosphate 3-epimerase [Parvimonas micra]MCK6130603.1 ribulose-phosphate 3-epimerase [Parvimonas micra]MCK6136250.1 ribulose-phosphate 3-epimerase [Parvimonas micra]MCK6137721.1 ribulose-phosphate 3-epimerase [Parvimonas micra]MCK6154249.1 ribulose-phosphate 3-epimerase [Parvimonas micra]WBB32845.1 ribulose-phosphate 3-epimerase [Parvimonas micra]